MAPSSRIPAAAFVLTALIAGTAGAEEAPPPPETDAEEPAQLSYAPRTIEKAQGGAEGKLPPPPPKGVARWFNIALSGGPGWLALRDAVGRDEQGALGLSARLGWVVAPEWNVFFGADYTAAYRGDARFSQTARVLGLQRFFFGRVYLGGAVGVAQVSMSSASEGDITDGPGPALSAMLGVEAWRMRRWALTAELTVTTAQYEREGWDMGGLRLGLIAF
jgi:hypothetical protein